MPKKGATKPPAKVEAKVALGKGSLRTRAFGEAVDGFGKEIVPLGPRAGALANRVGNHLLTMLEGSVYGLEKVGEWLRETVAEKLKDVPDEKIVEPDPRIAVPAVQALVYSMNEDHIRQMFANLLASNMNSDTKSSAHPAFVEMIKEMTPLEAKVIRLVSDLNQIAYRVRYTNGSKWNDQNTHYSFDVPGEKNVGQYPTAVDNLSRLRLLEQRPNEWPIIAGLNDGDKPDHIEEQVKAQYQRSLDIIKANPTIIGMMGLGDNIQLQILRIGLFITPLGRMFVQACMSKDQPPPKS